MATIKPFIRIRCEGQNSEPWYLKAYLKNREKDSTDAVKKAKDHSPLGVANEVEAQLREARSSKIPLENVYVFGVFDRDKHVEVPQAIEKIEALAKKYPAAKIGFAFSNPCIEFWFLLHFVYTSKSFHNGDDVQKDLKKHIPDYDKKVDYWTIFDESKIKNAIANAHKLLTTHYDLNPENSLYNNLDGKAIWDLNPYTNFHLLLENLP